MLTSLNPLTVRAYALGEIDYGKLFLTSKNPKHCSTYNGVWKFVCMFIWSFSSHSRIFHSYGGVTIAGEELQILTYARHSWPLSSEGSLTCHTWCDTGLPFIMVISEDPWHSHLLLSVWQWSSHYLFLRLRSGATWNRTACEANALPLRHLGCLKLDWLINWYFPRYGNIRAIFCFLKLA